MHKVQRITREKTQDAVMLAHEAFDTAKEFCAIAATAEALAEAAAAAAADGAAAAAATARGCDAVMEHHNLRQKRQKRQ